MLAVRLSPQEYESVKPLSEGETAVLRWYTDDLPDDWEPGEARTLGTGGVAAVLDGVMCELTAALRVEDLDRIASWLPVVRRLTVATASV